MEFQGLASGDPNIDAHPVRYMTQEGIPFMLAQSFDSVSRSGGERRHADAFTGDGTVHRLAEHCVGRLQ